MILNLIAFAYYIQATSLMNQMQHSHDDINGSNTSDSVVSGNKWHITSDGHGALTEGDSNKDHNSHEDRHWCIV